MLSIIFPIIIIPIIILMISLIKLIKNHSVTPDSWENEISKDEVDKLEHEICFKCGTGVKTEQYYCPKCNNATGKYVPYLPFVNIPFNYSMHQTLWSKLKSKDLSFLLKTIIILFIILTAPIMIVVYLLYLLFKGVKLLFTGIKGNSEK